MNKMNPLTTSKIQKKQTKKQEDEINIRDERSKLKDNAIFIKNQSKHWATHLLFESKNSRAKMAYHSLI